MSFKLQNTLSRLNRTLRARNSELKIEQIEAGPIGYLRRGSQSSLH